MPATGTVGTTASVAAKVMKPAPVTPGRALGTHHRHRQQGDLLPNVSSILVACAMNSAASVM